MIDIICAHIHNYFDHDRRCGTFVVENGTLALKGVTAGEYYRIRGSRFNDGVHRHPAEGLTDEVFTGEVIVMRPPSAFLRLVEEIAAWRAKYAGAAEGPFQSESVAGVYSYTRGGGAWQKAFADRLDEWRRIA